MTRGAVEVEGVKDAALPSKEHSKNAAAAVVKQRINIFNWYCPLSPACIILFWLFQDCT